MASTIGSSGNLMPYMVINKSHSLPPSKTFNTNHSTTTNHYHYFPTIPNNNPDAFQAAPKLSESLSLSNHSSNDFLEASSSDKEDDRRRNGWRSKMREFVNSQMRRFIEVQEAFLDKMLKTLENKEQERMLREEVWRREEMTRLEREHKLWAIERAWVEAQDVVLMQALSRITGDDYVQWREMDVSSLVRQKGKGEFEGMRIKK
ncbi:Trihelix transcription factor PTL [Acorus gramineus]|uniref:Trihelix transcription factor PTL n=1 Tax=Acorus gramineus TaxID=55184 RepID=A0AAV9AK14_ACOGR|nr:Trihelix transcription factor PTL [Acorus gramineus]